jgi:hypothetical protein
MNTRKFFVMFTTVLSMVAMLVSCNSVGHATEMKVNTEREIYITRDKAQVCVELNPITGCGMAVDCGSGNPLKGEKKIEELLKVWRYIEVPGAPCNSFILDDGVPGNTRYYCSGGICYPY